MFNTNPSELGPYTQRLPVYVKNEKKEAFNLWIFDSQGDRVCAEKNPGKSCISRQAVDWFRTE